MEIKIPDFDEWYVVERHPAAIQLAKEKWKELEQFKLEVNELAGRVKNNRHSLSVLKDARRAMRKAEEQCELHEQLTEMQRDLSLMKVAFRACGVIRVTHLEREFLEQAERLLSKDMFRVVKNAAVDRIQCRFGTRDTYGK